jgi:hypothetical protein
MPESRGENEGFQLLEEFTDAAITEPGAFPPNARFSVGVNEGMDIRNEVVMNLSQALGSTEEVKQSPLDGLSEPEKTALGLFAAGESLGGVARALGVSPSQARELLLSVFNTLRTRLAG